MLKVRAERRAGELLREMAKKGTRAGDGKPSHDTTVTLPTLQTIGISRDQSSRWQKLAVRLRAQ